MDLSLEEGGGGGLIRGAGVGLIRGVGVGLIRGSYFTSIMTVGYL